MPKGDIIAYVNYEHEAPGSNWEKLLEYLAEHTKDFWSYEKYKLEPKVGPRNGTVSKNDDSKPRCNFCRNKSKIEKDCPKLVPKTGLRLRAKAIHSDACKGRNWRQMDCVKCIGCKAVAHIGSMGHCRRLLLGGTLPLIRCEGLELSDEVYTLRAAICKVQAPELVFNINKVQHRTSAVVGQRTHHAGKEE